MQDTNTTKPSDNEVTVSIVSHGHGELVLSLLGDLARNCACPMQVLLTVNVPEPLHIQSTDYPFPLKLIHNPAPRGFGANHNAAFSHASGNVFCVLNPDVRIPHDPFPQLLAALREPRVAVVAPKILSPEGSVEDSARRFPTAGFLFRKAVGLAPTLDYEFGDAPISPDWVAGMFMLFQRDAFAQVGGFDERYFLYYEDVDLCRRLRRRGFDILLVPSVRVVHDARRESRRSPRHLRWHLTSMLRFLLAR